MEDKKVFMIFFNGTKVHTLKSARKNKGIFNLQSELMTYKQTDFRQNMKKCIPLNNDTDNKYKKTVDKYTSNINPESPIYAELKEVLGRYSISRIENIKKEHFSDATDRIYSLCSSGMVNYYSEKQKVTIEKYIDNYYNTKEISENFLPYIFALDRGLTYSRCMWDD